jgi:hypothetical protein
MVAILSFVALMAWPTDGGATVTAFAREPAAANIVLFATVLAVLFLNLNLAVENTRPEDSLPFEDWIRHSSLTSLRIVVGKTTAILLHTVFLVTLPLPIALVAGSVSGSATTEILRAFVLLAVMCATYRLYGLFLLSFVNLGRFTMNFLLWTPVLLLFLVTPNLAPRINPIVGLLASQGRSLGSTISAGGGALWTDSLYFHVALAVAFVALCWVQVSWTRWRRR